MGIVLEVAVTTADEALSAVAAGADRLEFGAALEVGGVTPSRGAFLEVREALPETPICVLVRPRPGNFVYSPREFTTLQRDAEWFLTQGATAIVCGVLDSVGSIDISRCQRLARLAPGRAVFHRAFDFHANAHAGLEQLIALGFTRVLTSGGAATATAGCTRLAELVRCAAGRIEVIPGSGITADNGVELLRTIGCRQLHGSFRIRGSELPQGTSSTLLAQMGDFRTTDAAQIRLLRERLDDFALSSAIDGR